MTIDTLARHGTPRLRRSGSMLALTICALPALVFADDEGSAGNCSDFSELRMTLEQNAPDGDTEVVFFAKGQDEGLKRLEIIRPDGRTVAKFTGDPKGIGIREFVLESASLRT